MGKEDDSVWPPPPETDDAAFERVTEGAETILGTGGPAKGDDVIYLSESDDE